MTVSHVFLIGGGRDPDGVRASHQPFAAAVRATGRPDVVALVLDEGPETDPDRWSQMLGDVGLSARVSVVAPDRPPGPLGDVGGVFVAGGLTPAYQQALCRDPAWLPAGAVYAGFSAGAAIAARDALVGGWRDGGVPVCDPDFGEDLEEIELRPGLGLVRPLVDVHCAQWGTLPRLIAAVSGSSAGEGWGIDEHTTLEVRDGRPVAVHGHGAAWHVVRSGADAAVVRARRAGMID